MHKAVDCIKTIHLCQIRTIVLIQRLLFFFSGSMSNFISSAILVLDHRYAAYQKFLGEIDVVTGIMGRRIYLDCCERILKNENSPSGGWFLFIDFDDFKTINDTLGHMTGDEVLKIVAKALKTTLDGCGLVGRLGGDEFSADILTVLPDTHRVSRSIGAHRYSCPADLSSLMENTDAALYEAKSLGKARHVIKR